MENFNSEENYKNLYLKYKKKYLNLKGGAYLPIPGTDLSKHNEQIKLMNDQFTKQQKKISEDSQQKSKLHNEKILKLNKELENKHKELIVCSYNISWAVQSNTDEVTLKLTDNIPKAKKIISEYEYVKTCQNRYGQPLVEGSKLTKCTQNGLQVIARLKPNLIGLQEAQTKEYCDEYKLWFKNKYNLNYDYIHSSSGQENTAIFYDVNVLGTCEQISPTGFYVKPEVGRASIVGYFNAYNLLVVNLHAGHFDDFSLPDGTVKKFNYDTGNYYYVDKDGKSSFKPPPASATCPITQEVTDKNEFKKLAHEKKCSSKSQLEKALKDHFREIDKLVLEKKLRVDAVILTCDSNDKYDTVTRKTRFTIANRQVSLHDIDPPLSCCYKKREAGEVLTPGDYVLSSNKLSSIFSLNIRYSSDHQPVIGYVKLLNPLR